MIDRLMFTLACGVSRSKRSRTLSKSGFHGNFGTLSVACTSKDSSPFAGREECWQSISLWTWLRICGSNFQVGPGHHVGAGKRQVPLCAGGGCSVGRGFYESRTFHRGSMRQVRCRSMGETPTVQCQYGT